MSAPATYSNWNALKALTKASLQSIVKSPSAIVFGLAFPLVFILVFGFLGNGGGGKITVAAAPGTDTTTALFQNLRQNKAINWSSKLGETAQLKALSEGQIDAVLEIKAMPSGSVNQYMVAIVGSPSNRGEAQELQALVEATMQSMDPEIGKRMSAIGIVSMRTAAVREYKRIDFILPGQLGFSLLAGSVFGTAFVFFNLRQTLVLKRFFATPVRREIIVLSEGIARMVFQMLTAIVIIVIGYFAFGFTLVNGATTFLAMLGLSALAIFVFMGFGFIISSIAKNDSTIPPLANLVTLPQFLMAGTFFPISAFPEWLQPFTRILPLTFLNDALRKVAFEGDGLLAIKWDLLGLGIWGIVLYLIAGKIFKWE